jgi:heme-degrading monooxygenase HmoA
MTHLRIWKFRPPTGREEEFALAYGAEGAWAALFGKALGYLGTELYGPSEPGGWWLTIDRWSSAADFEAFSQTHGEAYRALDAELEGAAGDEEFAGAFEQAEGTRRSHG